MTQIDIKNLFDESRFPSGWKLLSVFLYIPIGIILILLRIFICLQLWLLASILSESQTLQSILNRGFALVFGTIIRIDPSGQKKDEQVRIFVSNSISAVDNFVLFTAAKTYSPSQSSLQKSLINALGFQKMNMSNKDTLTDEIKRFLASTQNCIALQPEFSATNSRTALLKFNTWPFSIESSVQSIVLTAWRPEFVDIKLTSIASGWWTDVFWFMFVPCTVFTVKFLETRKNENADVLVREVESEIANELKIKTSTHTVSDKTEYEKRYILEKVHNRPQSSSASGSQFVASIEMQRMAQQVSEVLPLVPHSVILRDLMKTRNVDVTISNILDGIVTYTPQASPTSSSVSISNRHSVPAPCSSKVNTSALTFQEKKAKMIAEARQRYIEKHGLKDC